MNLENYKIKVNSAGESREVQELFFELGYVWRTAGRKIIETGYLGLFYIFAYRDYFELTSSGLAGIFKQKSDFKEITLQQLRNLVQHQQQVVDEQKELQQMQQENLVKYEDWINKETFEVKSTPQGAAIEISEWVKIPEDAEFAVSNRETIEFRRGNNYFGYSGEWLQGSWCKGDYPNGDWNIVWEREPATEEKEVDFIENRTNIFKKLLQGVKFQYRYNDVGQWHNLTIKGFEHLLKPNVVFREKPKKITIDGIEMDKDAAIKYIQKHY